MSEPDPSITIRPVTAADYPGWRPLWDGYNNFYGRQGPTALPEAITAATWARFLDPAEPMVALVAETPDGLVGLAHYLFHRSTTLLAPISYLQDLFAAETIRGRGLGRQLINAVAARAAAAGSSRLYWQTQESNHTARRLYDQYGPASGFIVYRLALPA